MVSSTSLPGSADRSKRTSTCVYVDSRRFQSDGVERQRDRLRARCAGPRHRRRRSRTARRCRLRRRAGAAARHPCRGVRARSPAAAMIPGQFGGDGAHLLVAGHGQERRSPSVGLHADEVEVLLRLGEHSGAVRHHRSAGVQVRVDVRGESSGRLQDGVEVETDLGQEREIRAEAGQHDRPGQPAAGPGRPRQRARPCRRPRRCDLCGSRSRARRSRCRRRPSRRVRGRRAVEVGRRCRRRRTLRRCHAVTPR